MCIKPPSPLGHLSTLTISFLCGDFVRVMLVSGALPPATPHCGVADAVVKIAQILVNKSVDVAIFTSRKSGTTIGGEQSENVKIFNLATSWGFRDLGTFLRTVRTWAPDLVHIQYPTQDYGKLDAYFLPFILFLLRVRVVQTWHENTRFEFYLIFFLETG